MCFTNLIIGIMLAAMHYFVQMSGAILQYRQLASSTGLVISQY